MFGALQAMQQAARAQAPSSPAQAPAGVPGLLPPPPPEPPQPPSCAPGTDGRVAFVRRFGVFGYPPSAGPTVGFDVGTQRLPSGRTLDQACEDAIAAGEAWLQWVGVHVTHPTEPERLVVYVLSDDLCVGEGHRVRLNMSALGFSAICRRWGWLFPSERIMDAIDGQAAVRLPTRTWARGPWPAVGSAPGVRSSGTIDNPGTGSAMMLNQAAALELVRAGNAGLISNAGKAIVSSVAPRFRAGTNLQIYGWNTTDKNASTPNDPRWRQTRIYQTAGTNAIHGATFVDYAQTARPVRREATLVRGSLAQVVDLAAIYRSPKWAHLVRVGGGPMPIRLGEP